MTPQQSWDALGLYGGDDGLTADPVSTVYVRAAEKLGLSLEIDIREKGQVGVTFLSRIYGPDVWYGDPNSCSDLPRQLGKFHVTTKVNIIPMDKLLEKSRAFYLTDANTPVLGEFVSKVINLHGKMPAVSSERQLVRWNSDTPKEDQYPNEAAEWMDAYAEESLGKYAFDFALFRKWLTDVEQITEMLSPPLCAEPSTIITKRAVVENGMIHHPVAAKQDPANGGVNKMRPERPKSSSGSSSNKAEQRAQSKKKSKTRGGRKATP